MGPIANPGRFLETSRRSAAGQCREHENRIVGEEWITIAQVVAIRVDTDAVLPRRHQVPLVNGHDEPLTQFHGVAHDTRILCRGALERIEKYKVSYSHMVPTMYCRNAFSAKTV